MIEMPTKENKKAGLKPEEWDRSGWIATCDEHLDDFYDEERDGYAPAAEEAEELYCDMKGCDRLAKYEIFGDLKKSIQEAEVEIEVERGDDMNIVMTDNFLDSLREIEEEESYE